MTPERPSRRGFSRKTPAQQEKERGAELAWLSRKHTEACRAAQEIVDREERGVYDLYLNALEMSN